MFKIEKKGDDSFQIKSIRHQNIVFEVKAITADAATSMQDFQEHLEYLLIETPQKAIDDLRRAMEFEQLEIEFQPAFKAQNRFSWEEVRYTFLRWLSYKIAKTEIGTIPPKWVRILHFVLFPLHGFYARQTQVYYSMHSDYYTIRGVKIAAGLFDAISRDAEQNVRFKFLKNESGIVTLERLS